MPDNHKLRHFSPYIALAAGCVLVLTLSFKLNTAYSQNTANSTAPVTQVNTPATTTTPQSLPPALRQTIASTQTAPATAPTPKGLYFVPGPPDGPDIVRTAAQRVVGVTHTPLPMYTLMAADGAGVPPTDASRFIYYIISGGQTVASVNVNIDPATGTASRGLMTSGGTDNSAQALDRLAALERVSAGSYEARLLSIRTRAGNTFPVFWLKADSGPQDDLYYPYRTYYDSGIKPETFYKLDALLNLLH
jgi:hypothetical protein